MEPVNIADLRNRLSYYINKVREGKEIIVRDRNMPVARIVPWTDETEEDELQSLASAGKVKLGTGQIDEDFWKLPAPKVSSEILNRILSEERDDG